MGEERINYIERDLSEMKKSFDELWVSLWVKLDRLNDKLDTISKHQVTMVTNKQDINYLKERLEWIESQQVWRKNSIIGIVLAFISKIILDIMKVL